MKLADARASIIGKCTEFQPTADFPVPDGLVNHMIFNHVDAIIKQDAALRRSFAQVEPWMLTKFECLSVELEEEKCIAEKCNSSYKLDLTFDPMPFPDDQGIHNVFFEKGMLRIRPMAPGRSGIMQYMDNGPSHARPHYTRIGKTLYFLGGHRDFRLSKIMIFAVVSGIPKTGLGTSISCSEDITVPIPHGYRAELEDRVVQDILRGLNMGNTDTVEDGVEREEVQ